MAEVDFKGGKVRLDPATTNNRDGRVFPLVAELRVLLEAQHELTRYLETRADHKGISRSVGMKLTGYKTESVYRRYAMGLRIRPRRGGATAR